jgi:hypothetical protein
MMWSCRVVMQIRLPLSGINAGRSGSEFLPYLSMMVQHR